jgi:hypothetical protein
VIPYLYQAVLLGLALFLHLEVSLVAFLLSSLVVFLNHHCMKVLVPVVDVLSPLVQVEEVVVVA